MHKRTWLRIVALLIGFALVAVGCGDDSDSTASGEGGTDGSAADTGDTGDTGGDDECTGDPDGTKIGLVYDIGGRGDQSFNDAAYNGLRQACEELGVQTKDLSPSGGGEDREELMRTLADDGYEMIIGVGFASAEAITAVAKDYPDITFGIVDSVVDAKNVASLVFAEQEGSFLVGAAAALTSESGNLGFMGGVETDLILKFEAGFTAGAQEVNPDAKVDVKYITQPPDFSGFTDPAKGKEIGLGLYSAGADVVFHAAGGSGAGLFDAALETSESEGTKVWAIGVDSDQYKIAEATAPEVKDYILTSMLKRVDTAVFGAIEAFTKGEEIGGTVQEFNLANQGIDYATSGDFLSQEIIDQLEELKQQIIDGDIEVPTTP